MQPRVLLDGLAMPESPRWHDGRLWFSNWGTRQIVAVDLDGNSDVVGEGPEGLGWATNWLPDGEAREVANELAFPNGMVITPDNKTLVVAESFAARLTAFDIEDDSSLSTRRVCAEDVGPDGICLDADDHRKSDRPTWLSSS